ncbi:hypothetical protein QQF64_018693 [Cirrhinus molitorella]|uniref:Uncharacterized protein n=1 Tax=Cirrhinus molitorella TaxID=172907 RepID=A0ABR3LDD7_9TELE
MPNWMQFAEQTGQFVSLPDTPEPNPAKKSKPALDSPAVSDATLMRFLQRMEAMHEETLSRIHGVEKTVLENSNSIKQIISSIEFHGEQVKCLSDKPVVFEKKIAKLEKDNVELLYVSGVMIWMRIREDGICVLLLSQKEKDARSLLWPTVEKARREGKRAGFHGPFAVIEGKRLTIKDVANR